eukprot:CAMPEP_0184006254 /NCGR_PEP_ID=MMETSP0954-20121128/567_1 /TAXON_ID=627963 /ORGANISM="Aplanochytrium sp, Strain PBS07" /LENGTH=425 /DNA_ID=CAMNT_0026284735 /DNA_START=101 /DNA_END=1378 /DNA_ORIENTATION=-
MTAIHRSVGYEFPTPKQLEKDLDLNPLFRYLPDLKETLPWVSIGNFPTPIHRAEIKIPDKKQLRFYVKREDLSSPLYGGNKVRTLQHQLAIIQSRMEKEEAVKEVVVLGSSGSNQVVATVVHGCYRMGMPTFAGWIDGEAPDLDNSLNMLSAMSFKNVNYATFGNKLATGPLEVAEQIMIGDMPDPDSIYVAMGSSCTVSGLIMGLALVKYLNLNAFRSKDFKIHGLPIHHGFVGLQKKIGLFRRGFTRVVPLTILQSLHTSCKYLREKLDGPDLLQISLFIFKHMTIIHDDVDLVAQYGAHSERSRAAANLFDKNGKLMDMDGKEKESMWLCGHFSAKSYAIMIDDMLKDENEGKNFLFWETKSAVQPLGPENEWEKLLKEPEVVQKWASNGKAESSLRPGKVNTEGGSKEDYRSLMTPIVNME